jgi:Ca2+-binding RTX toxin-like protein
MATITYNSKVYTDISGGGVGTSGNDYFELTSNSMAGGLGDDVYVVNGSSGVVTENFGEGTDTVVSSVNYTLGANIENLTLTVAGLTGTGNGGDNVFVGSGGGDTFVGLDGNDTYYITSYGDKVIEGSNPGSGVDTIVSTVSLGLANANYANVENLTLSDVGGARIACGNDSSNVLTGNSQDNILNGFGGADTMIGGDGNDRYVVDNAGDVVVETGIRSLHNNNADTILTYVNYTVSDGVENLIFLNSGLTVTGNSLDNTYTVVDGTDHVIENVDPTVGGIDTVISSTTYTLDAGVENLTLTGTASIDGTGNGGDNVLRGNSGANVLTGGAGSDTYYYDSYSDRVVELAGDSGTDTIISSVSLGLANIGLTSGNVENLTLVGGATIGVGNDLDNVLKGNSLANILNGGAGNDRLIGGLGNDRLWGISGADTFVFDTKLVGARNGGVDLIGDFSSAEGDHIELSSSIFTSISQGSTSVMTDGYIVQSSGALYYDADAGGSGAAVLFATLGNGATLSDSDFTVV